MKKEYYAVGGRFMSIASKSFEPSRKKSHVRFMTVSVAVLYVVSLLLGFVYSSVSNNIVYMSSALMYVLEISLQLLDLALYAVAFSFFIFATHRYGFRASVPFFISYAVLTACRRILSLVLELLLSGSVGADDFVSIGVYFLLDMITCAVVLAIIAYEFKKYNGYLREWKKAQRALGKDDTAPALCPFTKLYNRANPLQVCALKIGILLSSVKILSRIIFDLYYGAPTTLSETLIMVIYYLSDILIGVLVYAAMFWIFGRLYKEKKAKENEE